MKTSMEILERYVQAGKKEREDMWFSFTNMRDEFDRIERKDLIQHVNSVLPEGRRANIRICSSSI